MTSSLRRVSAYPLGQSIDPHKGGDPEVPVNEKAHVPGILVEAADNAGHEVADDDQVADADAKALDSDCRIKDDSRVGVRELREGKEGRRPALNVPGASRLQV